MPLAPHDGCFADHCVLCMCMHMLISQSWVLYTQTQKPKA